MEDADKFVFSGERMHEERTAPPFGSSPHNSGAREGLCGATSIQKSVSEEVPVVRRGRADARSGC